MFVYLSETAFSNFFIVFKLKSNEWCLCLDAVSRAVVARLIGLSLEAVSLLDPLNHRGERGQLSESGAAC
jgi:hypothetical protein